MTRRLCLITGASAGIGAAFARIYASHGYDVALTARREDRLEALAEEIRFRAGVETITVTADLSQAEAPDQILAAIEDHGRNVDALVNNAGLGTRGLYIDKSWDEHAAYLQIMTIAPCELARKTLPNMLDQGFGRIVNVASLAGVLPGMPGASLYGPTKSLLIKFSQALHNQYRSRGVHVSALCPGMTYSEFHDITGDREQKERNIPAWAWMGADEVAAAGYEAAEANRPVCIPGASNIAIAAAAKILPDEWMMALMRSRYARAMRV
jgi:short-subunit dehydrogenase